MGIETSSNMQAENGKLFHPGQSAEDDVPVHPYFH
jgi:hypothetical protein